MSEMIAGGKGQETICPKELRPGQDNWCLWRHGIRRPLHQPFVLGPDPVLLGGWRMAREQHHRRADGGDVLLSVPCLYLFRDRRNHAPLCG